MSVSSSPRSTAAWREANAAYLRVEMERIRVALEIRLEGDGGVAAGRLDALADEADQCQVPLLSSGLPSSIDVIARLFDLTAFERSMVLLCLAFEWDPDFGDLFARWHGDPRRNRPTPMLAAVLVSPGSEAVPARACLRPDAPLRHFELMHLDDDHDGPLSTRPLRLDDRMVDYLLGEERLDERVAVLVHPIQPEPVTASDTRLADTVAAALRRDGGGSGLPVVQVVGPPGAGRRAVAAEIAARMGWSLVALDAPRLPREGDERALLVRLLEREALLLSLAYYVDLTQFDPADPGSRAAYDDLSEEIGVPLVMGARQPWEGRRPTLVVRPAPRDAAERTAIWRDALGELGIEADSSPALRERSLQVLAQQFEFGPAAAAGTARAAVQAAVLRREAPGWLDVWRAARDRTHAGMESLAQRVEPRNGWDDLVLPDTVAAQLVELAGQCTSRAVVYERWGFGAKLTRGRGLTALFAGPSGTGKTLAAEVLASELDLAMYRIDLAGVVSKYIGETEKNLRRVFNAAEGGGAILFFDEADALFGKRSEVRDSHDRYANIEVDYLLQRMEEYRGLAILATNRKSHIDQAFLRRLRFVIDFPLPSEELRMRIWRRAFPPDAPIEGVDWDVLARLEISGASIKSIALYAAFLAAGDGGVIGMEQLVRAAVREYSKIDRLVQPAEFGRYYAEARR